MKTRNRLAAAVAAVALVASLMAVGTAPAGAADENTTVALFYDANFVEDPCDDASCESGNVLRSLEDSGATVNLIEDITTSDVTDALDGANVLVFPELSALPTFSQADIDAIREFVESGGRVVTAGGIDFIPELFDLLFDITVAVTSFSCENGCEETAEAAGTEFEGLGPLADVSATNTLSIASLPSGSLAPFVDVDDPDSAAVAVMPLGVGSVVYLGWDWFQGNVDEGPEFPAWEEVLEAATTPPTLVFGESISGAAGQTLVCPLTLDAASQPVVVSWEGVFASDGETFTGELTFDPNSEGGIEGISTDPAGDTATVTLTVESPFGRVDNETCTFTWTPTQATPIQPVTPAPATPVSTAPTFTG